MVNKEAWVDRPDGMGTGSGSGLKSGSASRWVLAAGQSGVGALPQGCLWRFAAAMLWPWSVSPLVVSALAPGVLLAEAWA